MSSTGVNGCQRSAFFSKAVLQLCLLVAAQFVVFNNLPIDSIGDSLSFRMDTSFSHMAINCMMLEDVTSDEMGEDDQSSETDAMDMNAGGILAGRHFAALAWRQSNQILPLFPALERVIQPPQSSRS